MKVLLLNSPWVNNDKEYGIKSGTRWPALRKKDRSMPYFPFPYFMASAAAYLKQAGFDAHIKDAVAEEIGKEECLRYVKELDPGLLVIEALTPSIYIDLEFAKQAKELSAGCLVAFCGLHASALPQEMLKNDYLDFVLLGEYDYALRDLCSFLSSRRNDFSNINGLAYKEGGKIHVNPRGKFIENLDEMPFPEIDELPMHKYNEPFSRYFPNARIVTSRGCPYSCIFCFEPLMYGRGYRKRTAGLVIDEIRRLMGRGIKEISFDDAIFTIPRAKEIAEGILKNNIKIAWSCWMDWNIKLDDLMLLKRSGCVGIKFGIESADRKILDSVGKPIDIDNIRRLIRDCKKAGILTHASFIFGLPGETKKSIKDTLNLAFSLRLYSCQFSIATPLPGTPFYEMALKNGWLLTKDWSKFEGIASPVIAYPDCSSEDLINAAKEASRIKILLFLRNPFMVPVYIWKLFKIKGLKGFFVEVFEKAGFILKTIIHKK